MASVSYPHVEVVTALDLLYQAIRAFRDRSDPGARSPPLAGRTSNARSQSSPESLTESSSKRHHLLARCSSAADGEVDIVRRSFRCAKHFARWALPHPRTLS